MSSFTSTGSGSALTGRKTVTTAGTAVQLTTSKALAYQVDISALSGNTNPVEVGDSSVLASASTQQGARLSANDTWTAYGVDLSTIYVDSVTNGEGVSFVAVIK